MRVVVHFFSLAHFHLVAARISHLLTVLSPTLFFLYIANLRA